MNDARQYIVIALCTLAIVSRLSLGCGNSIGLVDSERSEKVSGTRAEGGLSLISAEPVVFDGKGDPTHYALLADSNFETLMTGSTLAEPGMPGAWQWLTGDPAAVQWAESEESAIALPAAQGAIAIQQVTADLGPLEPGTELVATMRGKADSPQTLGIVLSYEDGSEERQAAEGHPGDGTWQDVILAMPVPQGIRQNQFKCTIVHRKEAASPAQVASVHLAIEKAANPSAPASLAVNGDFESYGFTNPPYPWVLDRWNSKRQPIVGGDALPVPASGGASGEIAMSFTPPEDATNVRISQPVLRVTAADAGTKLIARVQAIAHHEQELWVQFRGEKNNRDAPGQRIYALHPGDGQWHEVAVEMIVPKPEVADTIRLDLFRRSFTQEEAIVDDVRVERVP